MIFELLIQTLLFTVTGTDGSVCTMYKTDLNVIHATYTCDTPDQKQSLSGVINAGNLHNSQGNITIGFNSILCLIGLNSTSAPIAMGSLGVVPPHGIAWNCTGDGVNVQNGSAVWP